MSTPEQFIYDLQSQVIRLEKELNQAQQDIKDFEVLAIEWKKGYSKAAKSYEIKLEHAEQIIEELREELKIIYNCDKDRD